MELGPNFFLTPHILASSLKKAQNGLSYCKEKTKKGAK